jgi:diguanylate cyclase (GGDEF)-like protein/PAS domain S-box-containing protein
MELAVERARELTSACFAMLELREHDELVCRAVSGSTALPTATLVRARRNIDASLSGHCVLEGRTLACPDCESDLDVGELARPAAVRSMLCVPLLSLGQSTGVLTVYGLEASAFDDDDARLLQLIVGFVGSAIANSLAQQALASSEQRFWSLADLASDAIFSLDQRATITFANRSAGKLFGYPEPELLGCSLLRLLPERFGPSLGGEGTSFDRERAANRTLQVMGLHANGQEFPAELSLSSWSAGDVRFFTAVVRDLSEQKRLESSVRTLVRTDQLTALLNRAAGEEAIARELDRAIRYGRALSFVLLEIDYLKRINDTTGHAGGDHVLRRVGELILLRVRAIDVAIRWGGEEFLIVAPETELAGAQDLAESLRNIVEQSAFEGVPQVTISVGVASRRQGERSEQAISRASERLNAAKSAGRNRVEV